MPATSNFFKHWYSHDVLPLAVLITGVFGGVGFWGYHAAHSPDVVWDHRNNPTPWNSIREDEGTKLLQINQKFDRKWHREHL